jgi:hypothetical protein
VLAVTTAAGLAIAMHLIAATEGVPRRRRAYRFSPIAPGPTRISFDGSSSETCRSLAATRGWRTLFIAPSGDLL